MKDKIIKKLSINISVISGCILCGCVLSRDASILRDNMFLIGGLVVTNVSSNALLIKRYMVNRNNKKN